MDNKAAIQHLTRKENQTCHFANFWLSSDWDILSATVTTAKDLPSHEYVWIKGHQDSTEPRNSLPFSAQLNCEANDEAGFFQITNHPRPLVPMTPHVHAQLNLDGCTVTSHHKQKIREAATLPKYMRYINQRFQWDPSTNAMIDWVVYKQIIKKFQGKRSVTLMKHVHEIAPTGHIANRNQSHQSACCPACNHSFEDNDHVLRCPAASRSQWRTKTLGLIHSNASLFVHDPVLLDILRDGLQRWFQDLPPIAVSDYPPSYSRLIVSQTRIGWSHLFRGRWSVHWNRHHHEYTTGHGVTGEEASGTRWVRLKGKMILDAWFVLWDLRNKERHGRDEDEKKERRTELLRLQLTEIYKLHTRLCPAHQKLFLCDVATHMQVRPNLDGLEDWINTYGPAVREQVRQRNDIRRHFFSRDDLDR